MRALFGHNATVADFVGSFGGCPDFGACQTIGFLDRDGALEAGVVYHEWDPEAETIEMSAASRSRLWLRKDRIKLIFDYPFQKVGTKLVYAKTSNKVIERMFAAMGGETHKIDGLWTVALLRAPQWIDYRRGKLRENT